MIEVNFMTSDDLMLRAVDFAFVAVCIALYTIFRSLDKAEDDSQRLSKQLQEKEALVSSQRRANNLTKKCPICLDHLDRKSASASTTAGICRCQSCHESYHKDCLHFYICSQSAIKPATRCPCCKETMFRNSSALQKQLTLPAAISEMVECMSYG